MADAAPALAPATADAHARMGMADHHGRAKFALVGLMAAAGLVLGGCGPSRTTPDMTLRIEPAKAEPTATIHVDLRPESMSPDSGGRFVGSAVMMALPLTSAVAPTIGGDNLAAPAVVSAVSEEIAATKVAKLVGVSGADYVLTGSAESRDETRMHFVGLGAICYGLALIPPALGVPHRSYAMDSEAEVTLRRKDGQILLNKSYARGQSWWTNPYMVGRAENADLYRYGLNKSVCAREVAMQVAADVARAITKDRSGVQSTP